MVVKQQTEQKNEQKPNGKSDGKSNGTKPDLPGTRPGKAKRSQKKKLIALLKSHKGRIAQLEKQNTELASRVDQLEKVVSNLNESHQKLYSRVRKIDNFTDEIDATLRVNVGALGNSLRGMQAKAADPDEDLDEEDLDAVLDELDEVDDTPDEEEEE